MLKSGNVDMILELSLKSLNKTYKTKVDYYPSWKVGLCKHLYAI